jgi:hypothetical protein
MKIRYIQKTDNSSNIISIDDFFDYLDSKKILTYEKCRKYKWELKTACTHELYKSLSRGEIFNNPLIIIDVDDVYADWMCFLYNLRKVEKKDDKLCNNETYRNLKSMIDNELRAYPDLEELFVRTSIDQTLK